MSDIKRRCMTFFGTAPLRSLQINLRYYLDNIRVSDWRAYIGMAFLGFGGRIGASPPGYFVHDGLEFAITIILYLAFAFSINNCFDVGSDIIQDQKLRKNPIAAGLVGFREGLAQSLSLALIGLALTYAWFGMGRLILYSVLIFLAGAYSVPPLRFKSMPLVDLISHGLFFGALLYLYGASVIGGWTAGTLTLSASIFIYSITLELRNHLDDFQADSISETKTTVCWMGHVSARGLLQILLLAHWAFLAMIANYAGYGYLVILIGFAVAIQEIMLRSDYYLRLTDFCTCVAYLLCSTPYLTRFLLGVG